MKDYVQILQNLKRYLEYLQQDPECNPKVLMWVEREIQKIGPFIGAPPQRRS